MTTRSDEADRLWAALGDPMRIRLLDLLLERGEATASTLAARAAHHAARRLQAPRRPRARRSRHRPSQRPRSSLRRPRGTPRSGWRRPGTNRSAVGHTPDAPSRRSQSKPPAITRGVARGEPGPGSAECGPRISRPTRPRSARSRFDRRAATRGRIAPCPLRTPRPCRASGSRGSRRSRPGSRRSSRGSPLLRNARARTRVARPCGPPTRCPPG